MTAPQPASTGRVVILNGVSRAGKSTLARTIQESVPGVWMHIGGDAHKACTPPNRQPGVGLRPGRNQVRPEVEKCVPVLYAALFESVAVHARFGLDVVVDEKFHDSYTRRYGILEDCARRLAGLDTLFVGVRCPLEVIWERRARTWGQVLGEVAQDVVDAVELAQRATHAHRGYDLEVDTALMSPEDCAAVIARRLAEGPRGTALASIAALGRC
jgi:chloramphenicol 3-O phosphotransferase